MKTKSLFQFGRFLPLLTLAVTIFFASHGLAVPAIPEPPLILLGTVTDDANNQSATITSIVWQVTDGAANKILDSASMLGSCIVSDNGQSFYVLKVPFEVRSVQAPEGPVNLGASNGFDLKSSSPTYTLTAVVNGRPATVKSVSGIAQPPNTNAYSFNDYTPNSQGKMLRVDLTLPVLNSYANWAALYFPNATAPENARTADPDGDGATNEQEYLAGTDPKNPASLLSVIASSMQANGSLNVTFQTVVGKRYRLMSSNALSSFTQEGNDFTASSAATILAIPQGTRKFVKLEIVPTP